MRPLYIDRDNRTPVASAEAIRIRTLSISLLLITLIALPIRLATLPSTGTPIPTPVVSQVSNRLSNNNLPIRIPQQAGEAENFADDAANVSATHEQSAEKKSDSPGLLQDVLPRFLPAAPQQASTIGEFAKTTELLGPLTPIAMSPFFGITVLCGMTQIPDGWPFSNWLSNNFLLGNNPVLTHPATFWIFLLLTFVTSLPRFTKVTKPIAQALDWIESYAGLITSLLIMGLGLMIVEKSSVPVSEIPNQAGLFAWTINAFLLIAAAVNFLVVKSVRFLFEMLIWISPIPLVDACFEITNKSICFALLMLYATSPTLALILNLLIFVACLFVLNWAQRRVNYHWHIWLEPVIQWLFPKYRKFDGKNLWVYCEQDFPPFKKFDCVHLYKWDNEWYLMRYDWFWRKTFRTFTSDDLPMLEVGKTRNALVLQQQVPVRFVFHRGYTACLDEIAKGLDISTKERVDFRAQRAIERAETQMGDA